MAVTFSNYSKRIAFYMLILICIGISETSGQKYLSGNFSQPKAHVNTIGSNWVRVDNITGFEAGDTVLLIQMQGIEIDTVNNPTFGTPWAMLGEPGMHEFIIISAVNAPDQIVFLKNIRSTFNPEGKIQLVRVPYYNSGVVTGKLTCDAWDPVTGKGGVLAMIIGRSLKLEADIDVTGLGFRGALDAANPGGRCSEEAPLTNAMSYPSGFLNAGLKGEGMAIHNDLGGLLFPTDVKGEGPSFTGGGGGNGRYSGGGGGSNYGYGGIGGNEDCYPGMPGGYGGIGIVSYPILADRIRFGGGGGASTSASGLSGAGGNGGGIVIIIADTIFSAGGKIIADGSKGGDAIEAGGAGGGGGGGTIALYTNNYGSETLTLSVSGGNGGNNPQSFGEGGGGGGGLIYVSTPTSANVISRLNGGVSSSSLEIDIDRMVGIKQTDFKAILNGFLYNSIRSSVSGNQVDSVCSNIVPPKIQGTKPVGGTLPYTYKWEKYDGTDWILLTNDADPTNYTPLAPETGTVWYRRTITDSSPDPLVDESMPVKIIVQPFIKNNTIGTDAIICYAQDPVALASTGVLADGNGIYSFKWEASTDNVSYSLPTNINNTEAYTPLPALLRDSWYRRTVISGRCVNTSSPVFINVLDTISNNLIRNLPPEICNGMTFANLLGTTAATDTILAGGDSVFRFRWEGNINGAGWLNAPGTINMADYNPTELAEKIPSNEYYFRRVVLSGTGDVCTSVSNTVLLKDFPVITNNSISLSQVICSGTMPDILTGSIPHNGNGIYTYTWQDSSKAHSWTDIPDSISKDYQPPALIDTTSYRRIVYSSACSDISKSIMINVHKPILNNNISIISSGTDTTIWRGKIPHKLIGTVPTGGTGIPGAYTFDWGQSSDGGTTWEVATGLRNLKDYLPPSLDTAGTMSFRRTVTTGTCSDISDTINITVLPLISNNTIAANQTICYNTVPSELTGTAPAGGSGSYSYLWQELPAGGTIWTAASETNNLGSYSPLALSAPVSYRRIVTSGTGDLSSDTSGVVDIAIYALPTGKITNTADTTICETSNAELKLELTGEPPWDVTYGENAADSTVKIDATKVISVLPSPANALDIYNYSLLKVVDAHGCQATSLTGTKKSNVYKNPLAEAGPEQSVCGPAVTLAAIPTVGTGAWSLPQGDVASAINSPSAVITFDSSKFVSGTLSKTYLWEEINWLCRSKDSVEITFYKRISHINAGPDTTLYSLYKRIDLSSDDPEKWETVDWTTVTGSGNFVDRDGDSFSDEITGLSDGLNTFELKITNGTCSLTDLMSIDNKPLEIPEGFSPNNDPDGYNNTFVIRGLDLPNQIAILKVFTGAGTEVFSTSNLRGNEAWTDWDGKDSRGIDLPEGTYYYLLTIAPKEKSGGKDVFKGFIILKRY